MIVLHIVKATRLSGAERHLVTLLPALRARGMDARLLILVERDKPMQDMLTLCEHAQVPVQTLLIRRGVDLTIVPALRSAIRAIAPQIVHTHLIHADMYGMLAAQLAGVRTIISTRHNDDAFRRRTTMRWLNRWNWRGLTAGIAISDALATFVRTIEGAPAAKLNVIPYGLAHTRLTPDAMNSARAAVRAELGIGSEALLIGIASRLTEQKGIAYALEALRPLLTEYADLHMLIAGEGDLKVALQARTRALGMDTRVHFLGWRTDVPHLLGALDVFLMPSLWEGFGLTLLEAMSARVPIVATHVSAIPEIVVHGETGYLVAAQDPEAIAYALRLLLSDRELRQHMGMNGEDRVETRFSVDTMADKTAALYDAVSRKSRT